MGFFLVSEGIELEVKQNLQKTVVYADIRGGVEDTRLEAKTKDTKNPRLKPKQPFRGQTLSRPRTGMLEAKAKDQGHRRKCSKTKVLQKFF